MTDPAGNVLRFDTEGFLWYAKGIPKETGRERQTMKKRQWKKALAAGGAVAAAAIVKKTCEAQAKKQRQKEAEERMKKRCYGARQAYILGDGLTGLAAAWYLVRDARFPADQIHLLSGREEASKEEGALLPGGGLSGSGQYFLDEKTCENLWPLSGQAGKGGQVRACLCGRGGRALELDGPGLGRAERVLLGKLLLAGEGELEGQTVSQWFSGDRFFRTGFWLLWSRLYGLRESIGLAEFRRLLLRKVPYFGKMQDMDWAVPFRPAPEDGFMREIRELLARRGGRFEDGLVKGLEWEANSLRVTGLRLEKKGQETLLSLEAEDICILTDGDAGRRDTYGSLDQAAAPAGLPAQDSFWALAASKRPGLLGNPSVFEEGDGQEAVSFVMSFRRDLCRERLDALAARGIQREAETASGTELLLGASPWGLRLFLPPQPCFLRQPEEETVILGTGLYPERPGSYIQKPMTACTGREIWQETAFQLGIPLSPAPEEPVAAAIRRMPDFYAPSRPHAVGDRAPVIPMEGGNLALAGWMAEVPEEVPGSREQQVRSARMAVYGLLQVEKEIPPVTPYRKDAKVLARAVQVLYR